MTYEALPGPSRRRYSGVRTVWFTSVALAFIQIVGSSVAGRHQADRSRWTRTDRTAARRARPAAPPAPPAGGGGGCDQLTEREREVMALVGIGLSNEEIARRLVVSPLTARHTSAAPW